MTSLIRSIRRREQRMATAFILAVTERVTARLGGARDRGDVPGWVLITIMTAGLVTLIWSVAGPQLSELFSNAINNVKGP